MSYPVEVVWSLNDDRTEVSNIIKPSVEKSDRFACGLPKRIKVADLPEQSALRLSIAYKELVVHDPPTSLPFGELGVTRIAIVPVSDFKLIGFYWLNE